MAVCGKAIKFLCLSVNFTLKKPQNKILKKVEWMFLEK